MKKRSRLYANSRFLATTFAVNIQAVVEYRANFLLQVFGMMLNNAAFALFWGVLIGKVGSLGGYGFAEVMLSFSLYPERIFGQGMRWVFYTIVPSGFIAFVPLAALKTVGWPLVPLLMAIAAACAAASYGFFRLGLRRYESGGQMGTSI